MALPACTLVPVSDSRVSDSRCIEYMTGQVCPQAEARLGMGLAQAAAVHAQVGMCLPADVYAG